jgi:hypothetical protein
VAPSTDSFLVSQGEMRKELELGTGNLPILLRSVSGQLSTSEVVLRKVRRTEWKRVVHNVCQAAANLENKGKCKTATFV